MRDNRRLRKQWILPFAVLAAGVLLLVYMVLDREDPILTNHSDALRPAGGRNSAEDTRAGAVNDTKPVSAKDVSEPIPEATGKNLGDPDGNGPVGSANTYTGSPANTTANSAVEELQDGTKLGDGDDTNPDDKKKSATLRIGRHVAVPGGKAGVGVVLSSYMPLSVVEFELTYPGVEVIVGDAKPTGQAPGATVVKTSGFGWSKLKIEFPEPFSSIDEVRVFTMRVSVSKRSGVGTEIPLQIVSAHAHDDKPAEVDLTVSNGAIEVIKGLNVQSGSDATPTPGAFTATPTLKPSPTPKGTPVPARLLYVSSALGKPGDEVEFVVSIDNGAGIEGIQYKVSYNPALLAFRKHVKGDAVRDFMSLHNTKGAVTNVVMTGLGADTMGGEMIISHLVFAVPSSALPGSACRLELHNAVVADASGRIDVYAQPGLFEVLTTEGRRADDDPTPTHVDQIAAPSSTPTADAPPRRATPTIDTSIIEEDLYHPISQTPTPTPTIPIDPTINVSRLFLKK